METVFLLKDYDFQGAYVRAGARYTRNLATNTPIISTCSDEELELMYRQRFALDQPPFKRFSHYLDDIEGWQKIGTGAEEEYYYHSFPQFRANSTKWEVIGSKVPHNDRCLPYHWGVGGGKIVTVHYQLTYDGLVLQKDIIIWWGDNGREAVPLPQIHTTHIKGQELLADSTQFSSSLDQYSLEYRVCNMIAKCNGCDLENILKNTRISYR